MSRFKLVSLLILLLSAPGLLFPAAAYAGLFPPDARTPRAGAPVPEQFIDERAPAGEEVADPSAQDDRATTGLSGILGRLPLSFIPNEGQVDGQVRYYAQAGGHSVWFTAGGVTLSLPDMALRLAFLGAQPNPRIEGAAKQDGIVGYFKGDDPARWHPNLPTYGRVIYRDLWPGVDLAYEGRSGTLKSTFTLAPGADPAQIRLAYPDAGDLHVDPDGNLVIRLGDSELLESPPVAWQQIDGKRSAVPVEYHVDDKTYTFALPQSYDPTHPLVIDPALQYSTYVGGSANDVGYDILVDENGKVYVTGFTLSTDFPTKWGAHDTTYNGDVDVFVFGLNAAGTALEFSSFIGGSNGDQGRGIDVDGNGDVYVVGMTEGGFPTTQPPLIPTFDWTYNGGDWDAFALKLRPKGIQGMALFYSTYLGGADDDRAYSVAVDSTGSAIIAGQTDSYNFPTVPESYDTTWNAGLDLFVVKLSASGDDLEYGTYLGGWTDDYCGDNIALDDAGNAYLTGHTYSWNFPTSPEAFESTYVSDGDAFVARLSADGTDLDLGTFFGGSGFDVGHAAAVDRLGNVYVTGWTKSSDLPVPAGAYDESLTGTGDAFVAKFSPDGKTREYATYLGGSNEEERGLDIFVDDGGIAYLFGQHQGGFPTTTNAYDSTLGGTQDAFVTALNADGSDLVYSTYLGGADYEFPHALASNEPGSLYLTGAGGSGYPVTSGAYDESYNGGFDVFVTHFALPPSVLIAEGDKALATSSEYRENFHILGKEAQAGYTISDTLANYASSGVFQVELAEAYYASALRFSVPGSTNEEDALVGLLNAYWELATGAMLYGNEWLVKGIDTDVEDPTNALDEEIGQLQKAVNWYETATGGYADLLASDLAADVIALQPSRKYPNGQATPYVDLKRFALASAKKSRAYLELAERQFRKYTTQSLADADDTLRQGTAGALSELALLEALWSDAEQDTSYQSLLRNLSDMQRLHRYLLEGKNPFGFGPEYVPFVYRPSKPGNNYEQAMEQARDKWQAAKDALDEAEAHQRELDDDYDTLEQQLTDVTSTYNGQLIDLCGADPGDSTAPDLENCHDNEGGEIYLQILRIQEANLRIDLVEQQMANQNQLIRIEQERAARVVGLHHATAVMYSITGVQLSSLAMQEATLANRTSWTDRVTTGVNNAATGAQIGSAFGPFGAAAGAIIGGLTGVSRVIEEEVQVDRLGALAAKREHLKAQQDGYVAYAEAQIEDANSEALIKEYNLKFSEYDIELSIAVNNLAQELARLNGLATQVEYLAAEKEKALAFNRDLYEDPAQRVTRDYYAELASDSFGIALRYGWEAGRALAYEINQDPSFTGSPLSEIDDLYRVRDDGTLKSALDQMDTAFDDFYKRPDVPNEPQDSEEVVYLSQALGFVDAYDSDHGRTVTGQEKFKDFVRDPANRDDDGNLQFTFQTSIATGNPFFSTAVFNDKVTSVQMRLRGANLGNDRAIISLEQSGTSFMRTLDAFQGGGPDDVREYNVSPLKARITAATNDNTLPEDVAENKELATRSVAFTNWTLTLDQVNEPENQDVDINHIHDIEMTIGHEAYTLQTMLQGAEETSPPGNTLSSSTGLAAIRPQAPADTPAPLTGTYVGTVVITDPSGLTPLDLVIVLTDTAGVLAGHIDAVQLPNFPITSNEMGPAVAGAWAGSGFTLQTVTFEDPYSGATRQVGLENGTVKDSGEILEGSYRETITGLTPQPLTLSGEFRLSRPPHLPPAGQPASLHVSAMPGRIQPKSTTSIVVTLHDFYGDPVSGAGVSLSADVGTVAAGATTDSEGQAIVTYTAGGSVGWDTVSAQVDALTDTADIEIAAYPRVFLPMVIKSP